MEEKVLIKSEIDKKVKKIFLVCIFTLLAIALIFALIGVLSTSAIYAEEIEEYKELFLNSNGTYSYSSFDGKEYATFEECMEAYAKRDSYYKIYVSLGAYLGYHIGYGLVFYIINWVFLVLAGIIWIVYSGLTQCELTVTDKNVKGKILFGQEVVLPLHQISAYSTSQFLSRIIVATSSGYTNFSMIGNYKEIGNVLSGLINQKQSNVQAAPVAVAKPVESGSNLDELKKLKELLDSGILTQEEFDAKKKQILGL